MTQYEHKKKPPTGGSPTPKQVEYWPTQLVRPVLLSDPVLQAQVADARNLCDRAMLYAAHLPVKFARKTVVSTSKGDLISGIEPIQIKGFEFQHISPKDISRIAEQLGHTPQQGGYLDKYITGDAHLSHAELQSLTAYPGESMGVSKVMCNDCMRAFARLRASRGFRFDQIIGDPQKTHVFRANGTYIEILRDGTITETYVGEVRARSYPGTTSSVYLQNQAESESSKGRAISGLKTETEKGILVKKSKAKPQVASQGDTKLTEEFVQQPSKANLKATPKGGSKTGGKGFKGSINTLIGTAVFGGAVLFGSPSQAAPAKSAGIEMVQPTARGAVPSRHEPTAPKSPSTPNLPAKPTIPGPVTLVRIGETGWVAKGSSGAAVKGRPPVISMPVHDAEIKSKGASVESINDAASIVGQKLMEAQAAISDEGVKYNINEKIKEIRPQIAAYQMEYPSQGVLVVAQIATVPPGTSEQPEMHELVSVLSQFGGATEQEAIERWDSTPKWLPPPQYKDARVSGRVLTWFPPYNKLYTSDELVALKKFTDEYWLKRAKPGSLSKNRGYYNGIYSNRNDNRQIYISYTDSYLQLEVWDYSNGEQYIINQLQWNSSLEKISAVFTKPSTGETTQNSFICLEGHLIETLQPPLLRKAITVHWIKRH